MELSTEDDSNVTSVFSNKNASVRIVVATTCVLSMAGALSIILSYACIKTLQTQGRLILLNLALMDFGVGLSNFLGAVINFDQYYQYNETSGDTESSTLAIDRICISQAVLAHYFTGASVLWTACLAVYMYLLVFQNRFKNIRWYLGCSCMICYGIPLGMSLWLLLTNRLGHNEAAWCGLIVNTKTTETGLPDYFAITIGYDLWIYLTIALTVTIYLTLFLYLHIEVMSYEK